MPNTKQRSTGITHFLRKRFDYVVSIIHRPIIIFLSLVITYFATLSLSNFYTFLIMLPVSGFSAVYADTIYSYSKATFNKSVGFIHLSFVSLAKKLNVYEYFYPQKVKVVDLSNEKQEKVPSKKEDAPEIVKDFKTTNVEKQELKPDDLMALKSKVRSLISGSNTQLSPEKEQQIVAILNTEYDQVLQFFKSVSENQNVDFTKFDRNLIIFIDAISSYNSQLDLIDLEDSQEESDLNFRDAYLQLEEKVNKEFDESSKINLKDITTNLKLFLVNEHIQTFNEELEQLINGQAYHSGRIVNIPTYPIGIDGFVDLQEGLFAILSGSYIHDSSKVTSDELLPYTKELLVMDKKNRLRELEKISKYGLEQLRGYIFDRSIIMDLDLSNKQFLLEISSIPSINDIDSFIGKNKDDLEKFMASGFVRQFYDSLQDPSQKIFDKLETTWHNLEASKDIVSDAESDDASDYEESHSSESDDDSFNSFDDEGVNLEVGGQTASNTATLSRDQKKSGGSDAEGKHASNDFDLDNPEEAQKAKSDTATQSRDQEEPPLQEGKVGNDSDPDNSEKVQTDLLPDLFNQPNLDIDNSEKANHTATAAAMETRPNNTNPWGAGFSGQSFNELPNGPLARELYPRNAMSTAAGVVPRSKRNSQFKNLFGEANDSLENYSQVAADEMSNFEPDHHMAKLIESVKDKLHGKWKGSRIWIATPEQAICLYKWKLALTGEHQESIKQAAIDNNLSFNPKTINKYIGNMQIEDQKLEDQKLSSESDSEYDSGFDGYNY